jgi:hypothetical protein
MGNTSMTPGVVAIDTGGGVDELVKASAGDATAGYLDAKVDGTTITVSANTLTTIDAGIDHDSLLNFVANEHIDHSTVSISSGGILSGGGTIDGNQTITLANADIDHDQLTNFTTTEHFTMLDEDDLSSDSDTQAATQQSIKAYVDNNITTGTTEVFSSSGTWTCPVGVNYIMVSLCGGGGGGGGGRTNSPHNSGTGGGAGAAILNHFLSVTPTSTYSVTVGAAGTGGAIGAAAGNPGTAGGNSIFVGDDVTLTAGGGGGGFGGQSSDQDVVGAGGAGTIDGQAITSITDLLSPGINLGGFANPLTYSPFSLPGGDGGDSAGDSQRDGGPGGNSFFGRGGDGADFSTSTNPTAGSGIGSGGGGGKGAGGGAGAGANGAEGIVIISYSQDGAPT